MKEGNDQMCQADVWSWQQNDFITKEVRVHMPNSSKLSDKAKPIQLPQVSLAKTVFLGLKQLRFTRPCVFVFKGIYRELW